MNKRDEMIKEKNVFRVHSRGKSLNSLNFNQMANTREASRQKESSNYIKSKILLYKKNF